MMHIKDVVVYDVPLRRPKSNEAPSKIYCGYCGEPAYCKIIYDVGIALKIEYVCKICCNDALIIFNERIDNAQHFP